MTRYSELEFELYIDETGRQMVFLAHDGSSGCKYEYKDKEQLKAIIEAYLDDMIDEIFEEESED